MNNVTLLDGGMGQELIARQDRPTGLWSAQSLLDAPHHVREVHDAFFAAGADVATVNSYSVLPDRLDAVGLTHRLDELTRLACRLAVDARNAHGRGRVAGALGPIGFSYQPDKTPPASEAAAIYARLAKVQAEYADLLLLETMSSVDQARGGLMGTAEAGVPVWCAVSVDDSDGTRLRSGEPVEALAPVLSEFEPAAVLVNCSRPEAVSQTVPILAGLGWVTGAYANGFTEIADSFDSIGATVDQLEARRDLPPAIYADFVDSWIADGAQIVGGCCEIGPAHIGEIARRLGKDRS